MKKVPCAVMSRVVGYITAVADWNKGKKQEWKDRKTYRVDGRVVEKEEQE